MEESEYSEGSLGGDEETYIEPTLDPDNPDHAFPLIERHFNKVRSIIIYKLTIIHPIYNLDNCRNRTKPKRQPIQRRFVQTIRLHLSESREGAGTARSNPINFRSNPREGQAIGVGDATGRCGQSDNQRVEESDATGMEVGRCGAFTRTKCPRDCRSFAQTVVGVERRVGVQEQNGAGRE